MGVFFFLAEISMEVFVVTLSIHNLGDQSMLYNYYCFAF